MTMSSCVVFLRTLLAGHVVILTMVSYSRSDTIDVCQFDTLNMSCPAASSPSAILLSSARYGLLSVGKCASRDFGPGSLGCSKDVLHYMDITCSGRQACHLEVPGHHLKDLTPCPKGLAPFLQVTYECVSVSDDTAARCYSPEPTVVQSTSGFISSLLTSLSLGSRSCPWVIRGLPGQRVNFTLWDFFWPFKNSQFVGGNNVIDEEVCVKYGEVKDVRSGRVTQVCASMSRVKQVVTTDGHEAQVIITPRMEEIFLIQYNVVGCPDLPAPLNGWSVRRGNVVSMGCNGTGGEKWHLTCDGTSWIGKTKNCTATGELTANTWLVFPGDTWSTPVGVLIVACLGIALGLLLGITMLSVVIVIIKRKRGSWCCRRYSEPRYTCDSHAVYYMDEKTPPCPVTESLQLFGLRDDYGAVASTSRYVLHSPSCPLAAFELPVHKMTSSTGSPSLGTLPHVHRSGPGRQLSTDPCASTDTGSV